MTQYYFTMKGTEPNRWPQRCREVWTARGNSFGRPQLSTGYILSPGGDTFSYTRDSENKWHFIPFLKPDEHVTDFEALVKYRKIKDGSQNYTNVGFGIYFRSPSLDNSDPCSYLSFGTGTANLSTVQYCDRNASGTQSFPGSSQNIYSGMVPNKNTISYLKISVVGTTIKAKGWAEGEEEPSTWKSTHTGSATRKVAGTVGLLLHGYDMEMDIFYFSIGTNGDSPPTGPLEGDTIVSGILRKPDDTLAVGYPVSLSLASTGVKVYEATTNSVGEYSFTTEFSTDTDLILTAHPKLGEYDVKWKLPTKIVRPIKKPVTDE